MSNILIITLFSQLIFVDTKHVYYSDPNLSNPYIPQELSDSCGYRYGVINRRISYPKKCFLNSYSDQKITITIKESQRKVILTEDRVFGGRNVYFREAPWVVQIVNRDYKWYGTYALRHHCTGVLITMRIILTAAHCWNDKLRATIFAGSDEIVKDWRTRDYTFYQHPKWWNGSVNPNTSKPITNDEYDLGIIKLHKPIDWQIYGKDSNGMYLINTICLPLPEDFSHPKFKHKYWTPRNATYFGWGGINRELDKPPILQRADLDVKYDTPIYGFYLDTFTSSDKRNHNFTTLCKGDSGGGLIQYLDEYETRAVLIGIHVYAHIYSGTHCNHDFKGALHQLRVVSYLDWINKYLKETYEQN